MALLADYEVEHSGPVVDLTISIRNIAFGNAADLETLRKSPATSESTSSYGVV